jgi:hypothetical protein
MRRGSPYLTGSKDDRRETSMLCTRVKAKLSGARGTYGSEEKHYKVLTGKNEETGNFDVIRVDDRIILKLMSKK